MGATTGYADDFTVLDRQPDRHGSAIDLESTWTHRLSYGHKPATPGTMNDRVTQLTDGQRDCLRLVYGHMTSKDIARALGISPHTVDMRLRTAMKTLGVASRIDAARALIDAEGIGGAGAGVATPYQPLIYQAPDVADDATARTVGEPTSTVSDEYATQHSDTRFRAAFGPPASGPPRLAGASLPNPGTPAGQGTHVERTTIGQAETGQDVAGRNFETPLAGSLPWGARNTLTPGARLAWIAMIAIGSSLAFGAILGALEALKKLL